MGQPEDLLAEDRRSQFPRFQGENLQKNRKLLERVQEIAAEKNVTPGQLVLAWLLAQGDDIVPIPGTKRRQYLEENIVAVEIELASEDLRQLDAALLRGVTAGLRYPDMSAVNR